MGLLFEAHRGLSTDYPENTLPAFEAAADAGFAMVEYDPKFTRDGIPVILHDRTVGRTARARDGSRVSDTSVSDLTFSELSELDFGLWFDERFRGTKLPTVSELFTLAKKCNVSIKTDSVLDTFSPAVAESFLREAEQAQLGHLLGFTSNTVENLKVRAERFPEAQLHYDGEVTLEVLEALAAVAPRRLTVWMRLDNRITSWCRRPPATPDSAAAVHKFASLGIWILSEESELSEALSLGADIVETTGFPRPKIQKTVK